MKALSAALVITLISSCALAQTPPPPSLAPLLAPPPPTATPPTATPPTATPPTATPPTATPPRATPPTATPPTATPPTATPPTATPPKASPPTATPPTPASSPPPPGTPASSPPPPGTPASSPPPPPPPTGTPATPGSSGSTGSSSGGSSAPSDVDVLTFAYNLECLEGHFYSCAAFGTPLSTSITGNGPAPIGCTKANLNASVATYAAELARDETAHVAYLYNALTNAGKSPICPQVDIGNAFEKAAELAFGVNTQLNPVFNPYANDVFFLHGSFIFEDLGASAYLGGQTLISSLDYRKVAGQIGNAESYHSAIVRTLLYQIIDTTPAYNSTVQQITSAIVIALNKLSGTPQLRYQLKNDQGSSIVNVDSMGLVPAATVLQVLQVVTLGAPSGNGGGFFPNNLVGNVKN